MRSLKVLVLSLAALSICAHARAQGLSAFGTAPAKAVTAESLRTAPEWGTTVESALVIGSFEFQPYSAGVTTDTNFATPDRFVTAAAPPSDYLVATFHLPRGAMITGYDFLGCNTSASSFDFDLYRMPTGGNVLIGSFSIAANAGCNAFRLNVTHQVDATTGPYMLLWNPSVYANTQVITAARVYYKLQISPDPATATFGDVPVGHPFHRFVEALAASGITGGCGGGNYCPDAPITRGQMAVFLAGALGLHWAP